MQGLEVVDDNTVRHAGMTRIQSKNETAFQVILKEIHKENYNIANDDFKKLAKKLFYIQPLEKRNLKEEKEHKEFKETKEINEINKITGLMNNVALDYENPDRPSISHLSDDMIIDAYNDNFRRYFESLFAKNILINILNSNQIQIINGIVSEISSFLKEDYQKNEQHFIAEWLKAKSGGPADKFDSIVFFSDARPDLVKLVNENHFLDGKSSNILAVYDLHYLTHHISQAKSYNVRHPNGILEIYTNKHLFFGKKNRGRLSQFGFSKDNPSYNLGILRSIDKSTHDMRKETLTSNTTRCPDRLYMDHPTFARSNPNSWINYSFSNTYNQNYVNGLSGSILLEIRSILFFILSIKNGSHQCQFINPNVLFENNCIHLRNYFLMLMGIFVYFEGGHTVSEVISVFEIPEVKAFISGNETTKRLKDALFLGPLITENDLVLKSMKAALFETSKIYDVVLKKRKVHEEIESMGSRMRM